MNDKLRALTDDLERRKRVVVALSGGVDSAVLAQAARLVLGDNAVALIAASEFTAQGELDDARKTAAQIGITAHVMRLEPLQLPEVVLNDERRCYHCKRLLLDSFCAWATEHGYDWLAEGTNDDEVVAGGRAGWRAVREAKNVCSPLYEARLSKKEIRTLAHGWHLSVWNKPSAGCLATRIMCGQPLTPEALKRVELAEQYLRTMVSCHVRVRCHGQNARIEVHAEAIELVAQLHDQIAKHLKSLGFNLVTLDLTGYSRN